MPYHLTPAMDSPAEHTVMTLLRSGVDLLKQSSPSPRLDAEILLAQALGWDRMQLFIKGGEAVPAASATRFMAGVDARCQGQPLAYLTGWRGFWTFDLMVNHDVLVPRPETEALVERALLRLPADQALRVLDLGTGSGAIALAIASERPRTEVLATDRSEAALALARRNAERLGIQRLRFAAGDWFAAVDGGRFDLIASNPPYIADDEWAGVDPELAFEPRGALAAGPDGLDALRRIVVEAPDHLAAGGWLLLEHGAGQGEQLRALLSRTGFSFVTTLSDLNGRPRVSEGRWPG